MSTQPITIKIEDRWKHGGVAFLVDRDDFLQDIARARKVLGVRDLILYEMVQDWLKQYKNRSIDLTSKDKLPQPKTEKFISELLRKYHKPHSYYLVILYAILSGVVTDEEFTRTAYAQVFYPEYIFEDLKEGELREPTLAIILTPDTKLDEIKKVYMQELPEAIEKYKTYAVKYQKLTPDTVSNIQRDRKWYWLHKNGWSYGKITNEAQKPKEKITRDGVIKAIDRYRKQLAVDI